MSTARPTAVPTSGFKALPARATRATLDEDSYDRHHVRVILFDRPGYGASSRLPGRGISAVADDAAELLDHLGLDVVHVGWWKRRRPACARVRGAVTPSACEPRQSSLAVRRIEEADLSEMIELNREAWYAAHESWDALHALIAPIRDQMLVDPLAGLRAVMEAAPESDKAVMNDA